MLNAIIFDFDNTLYNYDLCNTSALDLLFLEISNEHDILIDTIRDSYKSINKNIKSSNNNSNKFNKIIYIKQLLEELRISIKFIGKYIHIYNTEFNNKFKLYDNIIDVIKLLKIQNINISILSNNIFHQQYDKIANSGLMDYIDIIQTTDECGEEKPNINAYLNIIHKIKINTGLENPYIGYIGDNFEHDIAPALKLNMLPFHYINSACCQVEIIGKYIQFGNYSALLFFLKAYFKTVDELIFLSKYFGQSNLNVQGPGGNISVKLDDIIFIKSSGSVLGNITYNEGYCLANNKNVIDLLIKKQDLQLKETKIFGYKIPSMETFFHSFMKKYTVHIHFTLSNIFFCSSNREQIRDFPYKYATIPYIPPGLLLSENIKAIYDECQKDNTQLFFLSNHGLIITSDNCKEVIEIYENMFHYFNRILDNKFNDEFVSFKLNKQLYLQFKKPLIIKYLDYPVNILINIKYCFPDLAIFIEDIKSIENTGSNKFDLSSITKKTNIIICDNKIYLIGETLNKVYYIIELLEKYKILCDYVYDNLSNINDIQYLQNMEQEKFRKI